MGMLRAVDRTIPTDIATDRNASIFRVKLSKKTICVWPWRWKHNNPPKYRYLFTIWQAVTSHTKTMRNSNFTGQKLLDCRAPQNSRRSRWSSGLRRRSAASRLLGLWVRIPPAAWMSVCCECCVLSGRGLCVGLITHPEESYRMCVCVCVCHTDYEQV
jgi:hypothetical protein